MIKLTPEEKDEWARAMHAETVSAAEYDELSDGVRDRLHRQVEALHLRAVERESELLELVGECYASGDWRRLEEWCAERMEKCHRKAVPSVADISDAELLRRAVKSAIDPHCNKGVKHQRWTAVMRVFSLGCTCAHQLCHRFDLDPDDLVSR